MHTRHMKCVVCVLHQGRASRGGGTCVLQPSRPLLTNYDTRDTQRCCERGRAQHSQPGEANLSRRVDAELALLYLLTNKCNHSPAQLQTIAVNGATHAQSRRLFIDGSPCSAAACRIVCCCGHPGTPHSHASHHIDAGRPVDCRSTACCKLLHAAPRSHLYTSTNHIRLTERAAQSANPAGTCSRGQCRDPGRGASCGACTHMPPT